MGWTEGRDLAADRRTGVTASGLRRCPELSRGFRIRPRPWSRPGLMPFDDLRRAQSLDAVANRHRAMPAAWCPAAQFSDPPWKAVPNVNQDSSAVRRRWRPFATKVLGVALGQLLVALVHDWLP
jgi:hypothetical protein